MEIYILQNNNIPFYVGKSTNSKHRFYKHRIKYGYDISLNIIDIVPDSDWKYWEKYYINLYKEQGYILLNKNNGGGGPDKGRIIRCKDKEWKDKIGKANKNKPKSETTKMKMSLAKKGKISSFQGKKHSSNSKLKISSAKSISIYQYNLEGNFIKEWKNSREIEKTLNINNSSILNCSKGKKGFKTAGGYIWSRQKQDKILINKHRNSKRIIKLFNNNVVFIFDSLDDASKKEGVCKNKIINSCKNKTKTQGKYKYKYYE